MSQKTTPSSGLLQNFPAVVNLTKAVFGGQAFEERLKTKADRLKFLKELETSTGRSDVVSLDSAVTLIRLLGAATAPKQQQVLDEYDKAKAPDVVLTSETFLRLLYVLAAAHPKASPKDLASIDSALARVVPNQPLPPATFFNFLRTAIDKPGRRPTR